MYNLSQKTEWQQLLLSWLDASTEAEKNSKKQKCISFYHLGLAPLRMNYAGH